MTEKLMAEKLGVEYLRLDKEEVVVQVPTAGHLQPFGLLHGGMNAFLVEEAASQLALLNAPEGKVPVGTELNLSNLEPNTSKAVQASATIIRLGRSSITANVDISDVSGKRTAIGRLTCVYITARR